MYRSPGWVGAAIGAVSTANPVDVTIVVGLGAGEVLLTDLSPHLVGATYRQVTVKSEMRMVAAASPARSLLNNIWRVVKVVMVIAVVALEAAWLVLLAWAVLALIRALT
jgi:hypothetical protein